MEKRETQVVEWVDKSFKDGIIYSVYMFNMFYMFSHRPICPLLVNDNHIIIVRV